MPYRPRRPPRPDAVERGYGTRWRKTRAEFLATHPTCMDCGAKANTADHLDGLGPLGPRGHDHANLEAVCHACHNRRTNRFDGGFGAPRRVRGVG